MQWITGGSILSALLTVILGLVCWHWLESGEDLATGFKMTWQDAKVATSCRSVDTTFRFIGRKYEDYQADRHVFAAPGWKHFICSIYTNDAERTPEYRREAIGTAYENLAAAPRKALDDWLKLRTIDYENWRRGNLPNKP